MEPLMPSGGPKGCSVDIEGQPPSGPTGHLFPATSTFPSFKGPLSSTWPHNPPLLPTQKDFLLTANHYHDKA